MTHTFNNVSKNRYRKPVAVVYGKDGGIPFRRVFKSDKAAASCAKRFGGMVFPLAA